MSRWANASYRFQRMTAGHKSTQAAASFSITPATARRRRRRAPSTRHLRVRTVTPESAFRLISTLVHKLAVTKTWNLCLPAHDPPFFSISCTSHSPAYGYGQGQQRHWRLRHATAAAANTHRHTSWLGRYTNTRLLFKTSHTPNVHQVCSFVYHIQHAGKSSAKHILFRARNSLLIHYYLLVTVAPTKNRRKYAVYLCLMTVKDEKTTNLQVIHVNIKILHVGHACMKCFKMLEHILHLLVDMLVFEKPWLYAFTAQCLQTV